MDVWTSIPCLKSVFLARGFYSNVTIEDWSEYCMEFEI